jgi:putative Holliday junction resolvase
VRFFALDVGDERIGVAVGDDVGGIARPLTVLARTAGSASYVRLAALVREHGIEQLVVGLPLLPGGGEGKQVASVRAYIRGLAGHISVPCTEWDERGSTNRARELTTASGPGRRRRAQAEDAAAAAVILQDYIDQHRG